MILERRIELVDRVPRLLQIEARPQNLDTEVVLLVHHHRERLVLADDDARATFCPAELAADEVALDENLPLEFAQIADRRDSTRASSAASPATAVRHSV
jgi:hypothetical protein